MTGPVRRGGILEDAGRVTSWSVAEGSRGRRWRWTLVDRRGSLVASHTLELDPDGRFLHLESATAAGLLSLHREADGSLHGNRLSERGVDHLHVPVPAPKLVLVGSGPLGLAALAAGLDDEPPATVEIVEVADDLGVRIAEARVRRLPGGRLEVRTDRGTRAADLDESGLPRDDGAGSTSWPLEHDGSTSRRGPAVDGTLE